MVELRFRSGTIEIHGLDPATDALPGACAWDERGACHRAPAYRYADIVRGLTRTGVEFDDQARRYETLGAGAGSEAGADASGDVPGSRALREPRPYQREALAAWRAAGFRGVVVLPTGAGKTLVAHMAIDDRRRGALVVTPTLDLVRQWHDGLRTAFGGPIGLVGGGEHDVRPLTVTTYDSAYLHMEHLGDRFGLVVFDECHHLPGPSYAAAARLCLAPFRLGLTATPERSDGRDAELGDLVGATVYRKDIGDLGADYLADYDTARILVELTPAERAEYAAERDIYRRFLVQHGILIARPGGWTDFLIRSSRSDEGRRAFSAYRRQKEIAFTAPAKLAVVLRLLAQHRGDRVILFTQDNATVYRLSRTFLIPAITHKTGVRERSDILAAFTEGRVRAIATSRVLNEGVDIPAASVAIVLSGSGSVREHVQRLGRILRPGAGKRALLYELVTAGTGETGTSERRREHVAYR